MLPQAGRRTTTWAPLGVRDTEQVRELAGRMAAEAGLGSARHSGEENAKSAGRSRRRPPPIHHVQIPVTWLLLSGVDGQVMMSSVKVTSAVKTRALVGEGPVWEEEKQTLLFVDIVGQKICRWDPATNQIQSVDTGEMVGFAVPRRSGGYVAGVGRSIVAVNWSTQTMTSLVKVDDDKPNNRLNDGKVDPIGRLLAGTMGIEVRPAEVERQQGSLFSVTSDLTVTKHLSQVDISNGLDWSLDQKTFFYIDSLSLTVDAFDYNVHTGIMGNRRVVYRMEEGEGFPDGMTVDADGRLWVACYNGGRVINIDPATGVRLQSVTLPVMKITSCCFGGPDYSDLYVTSARLGLDQSESRQQPLAGDTFKVTGLGVKGRPSHLFSG